MKITREQLRNIDVEAYIGFIETQCKEIEIATISLPFYKSRRETLSLNRWQWHSYFIQSGKRSAWYDRYEKRSKEITEAIKIQIEESKKVLEGAISLCDPRGIASAINDNPGGFSATIVNSIDFDEIKCGLQAMRCLFETSIEADLEAIHNRLRFDKGAIDREIAKAESEDYQYLEWILEGKICRQYIYDNQVVFEFARLEFLHRLAMGEYSTAPETIQDKPIKWVGKTAHLGYYLNALADAGYIDAPRKKNGEINYNAFARAVAAAFNFESNSIEYLAKSLSPDGNNMEFANKDKIFIPHIKELG